MSKLDAPPIDTGFGPRFAIERELGAGAFGTVYAAFDHERKERVALKALHRRTPEALFRFKREFRGVAAVHHPNLVRLYELFAEDERWFFTMELVTGTDFLRHVRGTETLGGDATIDVGDRLSAPPLDRLEQALVSMLTGIEHLHAHGIIHRDLKPSNVICTNDGRVVLLDFGVMKHVPEQGELSVDNELVGTPAYMAPEQLSTRPITAKADIYALGVMLFEALTARKPFVGSLMEIADEKRKSGPPDPRRFADVPERFAQLVSMMMQRDPSDRPAAGELLGLLQRAPQTPKPAPVVRSHFVGRSESLGRLQTARASLTRGRTVVSVIMGEPGMGKTSLLRRFVELERESGSIAFYGQCFQRESVPYKAFDPLMDAFVKYASALPPVEAARLLPLDLPALARLFPVLQRLDTKRAERVERDPISERRAGVRALRELLHRLADRAPTILVVDDMDFADRDSLLLLVELLSSDPPACMFVFALPNDAAKRSLELRQALRSVERDQLQWNELSLGPLAEEEALSIAKTVLPNKEPRELEAIVRESDGVPLFVWELVRAVAAGQETSSFAQALRGRLRSLTELERRVLMLLAVSAGPLRVNTVAAALDVPLAACLQTIDSLRQHVLIRAAGDGGDAAFMPIHERVRAAIVELAGDESPAVIHKALARALIATAPNDYSHIAQQLRLAGEVAAAAPYAVKAGDLSHDAFAFADAALWYERALEAGESQNTALQVKYADALALDGRGEDAARAYMAAAAHAGPTVAWECKRKAAEKWLRSGHITRGEEALHSVLADVNLSLPRSRASTLFTLFSHQLTTRPFKADKLVVRKESEIEPLLLRQIDASWSAATGFIGVRLLLGAAMQARHLALATKAGEVHRLTRALAMSAVTRALQGGPDFSAAETYAADAERMAQQLEEAHAMGWSVTANAVVAWCQGRFRESLDLATYAVALFRTRPVDASWEVGVVDVWFRLRSLLLMGQFGTLATETPKTANAAERRGDIFTYAIVKTAIDPIVQLARGTPADARRTADEALARWRSDGWHTQHKEHVRAHVHADLYDGDPQRALARLKEAWPKVEHSLQMRAQTDRIQFWALRGRAALLAADERPAALTIAERDAKLLRKERHPWANAHAAALEAGIAARRQAADATVLYAHAAEALEQVQMNAYAWSAIARAAELSANREQLHEAHERLHELGVKDAARFGRTLVP